MKLPHDIAWSVIKEKKDAPNYRKASSAQMANGKNCGTCKAWDSSKTDSPETGYCKWFDFVCKADYICDSWVKKG